MITFEGPYHISQLRNLELEGKRGVYIWGFAFQFKDGKCDSPVNLNEENILSNIGDREIVFPEDIKFIPYYVGQSDDLRKRINKHSNFLTNPENKYTRFSMKYMNEFFTGNGFPIYNTRVRRVLNVINFSSIIPDRLDYFNNDVVLKNIYPHIALVPAINGKHTNWPINNQQTGGKPLFDTLDTLRNVFNNFFFCYVKEDSVSLSSLETSTFWALKGFTISKVNKKYTAVPISGSRTCNYLFRTPVASTATISTPALFPGNY